jgi:hypothetical protein
MKIDENGFQTVTGRLSLRYITKNKLHLNLPQGIMENYYEKQKFRTEAYNDRYAWRTCINSYDA